MVFTFSDSRSLALKSAPTAGFFGAGTGMSESEEEHKSMTSVAGIICFLIFTV